MDIILISFNITPKLHPIANQTFLRLGSAIRSTTFSRIGEGLLFAWGEALFASWAWSSRVGYARVEGHVSFLLQIVHFITFGLSVASYQPFRGVVGFRTNKDGFIRQPQKHPSKRMLRGSLMRCEIDCSFPLMSM